MAKIHGMLDVGKRAMQTSQIGLQTTSHNMTNKSTEGYSVQRVEVVTSPSIGEGTHRMGTGTRLAGISRSNNPWIEKQLEKEGANLSHFEQKANSLAQLESTLNETNIKGINDALGSFFNSFRELANNPESSVGRVQVRESAVNLLTQLQSAKKQIASVKGEMNNNLQTSVSEVNSYADQISVLNQKIQSIEFNSSERANDERDRRDLLIKKIAEHIEISHNEDPQNGMVTITAGRSTAIVSGLDANHIKLQQDANGDVKIMHEMSKGGTQVDVTDQFQKGKIGAALEVRDITAQNLMNNIDELSFGVASEVNKAHVEGFDNHQQTGSNFFTLINSSEGFSTENLKVSDSIMKDVNRIAAAAKPNAPGDNTIANIIQNLQTRPLMGEGKFTYGDYFSSKVGEVGLLAQTANTNLETQKNTFQQLTNFRENVSGVNLDEEATKLIEYQKSFEASARLIRTADEMFDTVLNLKRL